MKDNTKEARAGRATPSFMTGIDLWEDMTFECKGCGRTLAGRIWAGGGVQIWPNGVHDCGKVVALACFPTGAMAANPGDAAGGGGRRKPFSGAPTGTGGSPQPDQLPDIAATISCCVDRLIARPWRHRDPLRGPGDLPLPTAWVYYGCFMRPTGCWAEIRQPALRRHPLSGPTAGSGAIGSARRR